MSVLRHLTAMRCLILLCCCAHTLPSTLCRINFYDFTDLTAEFNNATRFIGQRKDVASVAVRVVAIELEAPRREFVVAHCVFESMLAVEAVDALYTAFPRRRYVPCKYGAAWSDAIAKRRAHVLSTAERSVVISRIVWRNTVLGILGLLVCIIALIIALCVERT
jgi:hypothetical protein